MSQLKPHRRLSLTSPTSLATESDSPPAKTTKIERDASPASHVSPREKDVAKKEENAATDESISTSVVRVMAYLSEDEAQMLDDLWLAARRAGARSSKSDILRAALHVSSGHANELNNLLSQQHTNTLSRHRNSKMRSKTASDG